MPPRLNARHVRRATTISNLASATAEPVTTAPSPASLRRLPHRPFSSTPSAASGAPNRQRQAMWEWLNGAGSVFRRPLPGSTNYLSAYDRAGRLIRAQDAQQQGKGAGAAERKSGGGEDGKAAAAAEGEGEGAEGAEEGGLVGEREMNTASGRAVPRETGEDLVVFPDNPHFRSQPVLSEELKDMIFRDLTVEGEGRLTIREVSAKYGVEMNRVGAVLRLKSVEKKWVEEGKPLASAYADAVMAMLPQTQANQRARHEEINDLPIHRATARQLFYPASESRSFTRRDAGRAFAKDLLPADKRIPHPQLVALSGAGDQLPSDVKERREVVRQQMRARDEKEERRATRAEREREENTVLVKNGRWEYRFEDVMVDESTTGRFVKGVGARYGVPAQDRKKGMIKIPRKVE